VKGAGLKLRLPVFAGGIVAAFVAALVLFGLLLGPSRADLEAMALFLAITATASIAVGYVAARSGWMRRSPHVSWTLLAGFLLTGVLAFVNVFATARLMFVAGTTVSSAVTAHGLRTAAERGSGWPSCGAS